MKFDLDADFFHRVYGWFRNSPLLPVLGWLTHLGDSKVVFLLACGGFGERLLRRAPPLVPWLGVPIAAGVTGWIKGQVARPRPSEVFSGLGIGIGGQQGDAFPSGHATLIFALATAACIRWPRARALWLGAASLVALSRVALGLHWPSDVIVGAAIGSGMVTVLSWFEKWLTRRWRKRCFADSG